MYRGELVGKVLSCKLLCLKQIGQWVEGVCVKKKRLGDGRPGRLVLKWRSESTELWRSKRSKHSDIVCRSCKCPVNVSCNCSRPVASDVCAYVEAGSIETRWAENILHFGFRFMLTWVGVQSWQGWDAHNERRNLNAESETDQRIYILDWECLVTHHVLGLFPAK